MRAGGTLCGLLIHHTQPLGSEGPGRRGSETISGEKRPFAGFPVHRQLPAPSSQWMAASWFLQCQEVFSAMGCSSSPLSSQGSNDNTPTCRESPRVTERTGEEQPGGREGEPELGCRWVQQPGFPPTRRLGGPASL